MPLPPAQAPDTTSIPTAITSNFDVAAQLGQSWASGVLGAIPESADFGDHVGAFRFLCAAAQINYDDPIVYPGQPGKSHLHQFFGNTLANANSTYASLRSTGDSTCMNKLNRSAYWMPAMLNGKGQVVRPDYVSIYYKRIAGTNPDCQKQGKACVGIPRGLRFVFGYDMMKMGEAQIAHGYFNCQGKTAIPGNYPTITAAIAKCPAGNQLGAIIQAPDCWDGVHLDSPDHRSHMAYPSYGDWGYLKCPSTHPYVIPTFTLGAWFTTDDDLPTWRLSSDEMPGMPVMTPGSTFHSDWFGAWDDATLATWEANCIDKVLSCVAGDLGNGTALKQAAGISYTAEPRLVNVPAR